MHVREFNFRKTAILKSIVLKIDSFKGIFQRFCPDFHLVNLPNTFLYSNYFKEHLVSQTCILTNTF